MANSESAFTVNIKAGGSFDAPWIIVKANTVEKLKERLCDLEDHCLDIEVVRVSRMFQTFYNRNQAE